jgi:hypothetical protein
VLCTVHSLSVPYSLAWRRGKNNGAFKGIVSRDLHICLLVSIDRSQVATPYGAGSFAFKISFSCRIFRFRVSAYIVYSVNRAGLLDFPQLLSKPRTRNGLMQMLFWRKIFEDKHCPSLL